MNLIEKFENMPFQDVGTFNSIFKTTPILNVDFSQPVEICELKGNERRIKVGNETIYMDLTQKKSALMEKKKKREKPKNVRPRHNKIAITLPDIYRLLSPVEFVIYSAIKEVKEVGGVEELSRHLGISNKTILLRLKKLVNLNLVKREFVSCGSGSYLKITLVNDSV